MQRGGTHLVVIGRLFILLLLYFIRLVVLRCRAAPPLRIHALFAEVQRHVLPLPDMGTPLCAMHTLYAQFVDKLGRSA